MCLLFSGIKLNVNSWDDYEAVFINMYKMITLPKVTQNTQCDPLKGSVTVDFHFLSSINNRVEQDGLLGLLLAFKIIRFFKF